MNIKEITNGRPIPDIIADLKNKSIRVPSWEKLQKEYDPRKHPVMTDPFYKDRPRKSGGVERMSRVTLGWMQLAVKRMTELLFGIDVLRIYNDHDDKRQKEAAQIIEAIYAKNRISSVNISRSRYLYASCEAATIWYTQEQPAKYAGRESPLKLRCRTFSPFSDSGRSGEALYPLFDEFDDLVALSIEYARTENNDTGTYFETYTAEEHIRWRSEGGKYTEVLREHFNIGKIPGIYIHRPEPIWENQAENVFELEWALSRNGNYIRKNSRPIWVVATDEDISIGNEAEGDGESRSVLRYPADAKYGYATWPYANDSLKFLFEAVKREYFTHLQLPDMSMDNLKSVPASGESRKMYFIDGQMKAKDESGPWLEFLSREYNVIISFGKLMFPDLTDAFDALEVEHRITPYQIKDESERLTNINTAAGGKPFMSQRTAVKEAGYVDDIEAELELIGLESKSDIMESSF